MFNDMLMNSRAILGVTLAAVFAVSMIMVPVFAGGHLIIESSEMKKFVKKGEIDLAIKVTAKIPKDETGLFGWALLGWDKVLVLVTHVPAFDDSDFDDKKGAFHTHVLSLIPSGVCGSGTEIDTVAAITDPGYKNKVGNDNIKIKKVALADLGARLIGDPIVVAAFFITAEPELAPTALCINVPTSIEPDIKTIN